MEHDHELSDALLGDEQGRREVTKALLEITSRAAANAEGEVGVGLSVLVSGSPHSIGATSDPAQQMDQGQADDDEGPCLHALSTGELVDVDDYTDDERWPATSRRATAAGIRSSLSLPLRASDDHVLGALNVYSNAPSAFGGEAKRSLQAFAEQATTSLLLLGQMQTERTHNAYVTAFTHTIQASLRCVLPRVPGVELIGASTPSSPHAAVGGDWYDAFVLPDGSTGLVIGDVMGHGIEAVTAMAQVRTMVRTAAMAGLDPAAVLDLTDRLAHQANIEETVTLFYAHLHTEDGKTQLQYCNAGHPRPLLRAPDGTMTELANGTRILLGAIGTNTRPDTKPDIGQIDLTDGSLLLLYTDGLIEREGAGEEKTLTGVSDIVAGWEPNTPLEGLCRKLLDPPSTSDDTTVFLVHLAPATS